MFETCLMLVFDLAKSKICPEELTAAYVSGSWRDIEIRHNVRIVVADRQYLYVLSPALYVERLGLADRPLGGEPLDGRSILLMKTRVRTNEISDGEAFYTFGNVYGGCSILAGPKLREAVADCARAGLIGRRLKNVELRAESGEYRLVGYELRE